MSASIHTHRSSVRDIVKRKGGAPIVCLTAYSATVAKIIDRHVDLILVGDSLGMVCYGMDNTQGVSVDMMVAHGAAVVGATERACIVVDLPFGSYESAPSAAFETASRVLSETGCAAVKFEGGVVMAETVRFLVERGIPVMGHVGLQPQSVKASGGFRVHGRTEEEAARIRADARAIAEAGSFAIVLENVVEPLGRSLTAEIAVPTIGIGASPACDGQILVTDDMVGGFTDFTPRFVKRFADVAGEIDRAAEAYAGEVAARRFPAPEHCAGGTARNSHAA